MSEIQRNIDFSNLCPALAAMDMPQAPIEVQLTPGAESSQTCTVGGKPVTTEVMATGNIKIRCWGCRLCTQGFVELITSEVNSI